MSTAESRAAIVVRQRYRQYLRDFTAAWAASAAGDWGTHYHSDLARDHYYAANTAMWIATGRSRPLVTVPCPPSRGCGG